MSKKTLADIMNGFKRGVLIGLCFALLFSLYSASETFQPMSAHFIKLFPNELIALIVAIISWGGIGAIFTLTNYIFTKTDWGILKMTVIHAGLSYGLLLPIALFLTWVTFDYQEIFKFTAIYLLIYILFWSYSMIKARKAVAEINQLIN